MSYELGFDIGGTFTDFALLNRESGELEIFKALTTADNPEVGALAGLATFLRERGLSHDSLLNVYHGTTLVANTLIEHKGALVGALATAGFRDILEMRSEQRYAIYDLFLQYPPPLSPRYLRRGVRERIDRDGRVLEPVCEKDVLRAVADFKRAGVEAIAIACLHAYRNPQNERRIAEIVGAAWPEIPLSLSSDIAPEIREYERTSTTVANAYTLPLMARYLKTLDDRLAESGFGGNFYLMLSSGSSALAGSARSQPIRLVESGPAAGALAAAYYGGLASHQDLISFDMGGTTAKVALIHEGAPAAASNLEVARVHRFTKGSGYPLQFPTVNILESGAGGGSIAWIDGGGILQIGPHSAGADPGPACYGKGGQDPTVTDANLVLGRIGLSNPIGRGESWSFDKERAEWVINDTIASPLDLSVIDAAWAILEVANQRIANSIRMLTVERGYDPRDFVLVAYGGAGPLHACSILNEIQTAKALIPPWPGVTSALGCIIADVRHDFIQMVDRRLDDIRILELYDVFEDHAEQGKRRIAHERVQVESIDFVYQADVSYDGQMYEVLVHLPVEPCTHDDIRRAFEQAYAMTYGHILNDRPIRVMTLRTAVIGVRPGIDLFGPTVTRSRTDKDALKEHRPVYFEQGFKECPVYDRDRLPPKSSLLGPAIVEQGDATTVIEPNMVAEVDVRGNLIIRHGH